MLNIPPLDTVKVLGIGGSPTKAFYNGNVIEGFSFNNQVLLLTNINVDLNSSLKITWE